MGRRQTANDLEEKTESVIDANDLILERVNNMLDEAQGKKKSDPALVVVVGGGSGGAEIGNPIGDEAEVAEAAPGEALVRPSALRRSSE